MRTHKGLLAWQRAHTVAMGVHRYAVRCWKPDYAAVLDQLRRAALSVELNIAEGFASGRTLRCKALIRIAYGSSVETTALLEFLTEFGATNPDELVRLHSVSRETQALTLRLWKATAGPSQRAQERSH